MAGSITEEWLGTALTLSVLEDKSSDKVDPEEAKRRREAIENIEKKAADQIAARLDTGAKSMDLVQAAANIPDPKARGRIQALVLRVAANSQRQKPAA